MEDITFKPKYSKDLYVGAITLLLGGGFIMYFGYKENYISYLVFGGLLFLMGLSYPFFIYTREVVFTADKIIIKKFLLARKSLDYQDFSDMSPYVLKFRRYRIPLVPMKNAEELVTIFQELIDNGYIQKSQITRELARDEVVGLKAVKYTLIPTALLFLTGLLLEFFKIRELPFIMFTSPLIILFVIYFFLKRKSEIE